MPVNLKASFGRRKQLPLTEQAFQHLVLQSSVKVNPKHILALVQELILTSCTRNNYINLPTTALCTFLCKNLQNSTSSLDPNHCIRYRINQLETVCLETSLKLLNI